MAVHRLGTFRSWCWRGCCCFCRVPSRRPGHGLLLLRLRPRSPPCAPAEAPRPQPRSQSSLPVRTRMWEEYRRFGGAVNAGLFDAFAEDLQAVASRGPRASLDNALPVAHPVGHTQGRTKTYESDPMSPLSVTLAWFASTWWDERLRITMVKDPYPGRKVITVS